MKPLVEVDDVHVVFKLGPIWARTSSEVLQGISLKIHRGETIALVGESGSGKTTLAKVILGLIPPKRGAVSFFDNDAPASLDSLHCSAVLQNPLGSLNPRLSVRQSLVEASRSIHQSKKEMTASIHEMLNLVSLDPDILDRVPHELSGGQRQRVSIARALVTHPDFVLFDEPTSALDVSVQSQVLNLIKELQRKRNFSALFITHDLAAARFIAHRVLVMYAGIVFENISSVDLFHNDIGHPYTKCLKQATGLIDQTEYRLSDAATPSAQGCPLQNRCPTAIESCQTYVPRLENVGDRQIACLRAAEI